MAESADIAALFGVWAVSLEFGQGPVGHRRFHFGIQYRISDKALDQERHCSAGVGKYPTDVPKFLRVAAEDDVCDGTGGIRTVLNHDRLLRLDQIDAAIGRGRMGVDNRLAPIEFFHDGQKQRISEPLVTVTRHEADPVGLERVERIGDLLQASLDVRERNHCKASEAAWMVCS